MKKSINGEIVNVSKELVKLSNNLITQMMLGIKYSSSKERGKEVYFLIREVTEISGQFNVSDIFGFLRNLDLQGFLKKSTDIRSRYHILHERIIKEREEVRSKANSEGGNKMVKDFLDILLDASKNMNSEKARKEIDSFVGRNVRLVDESDLPYLQSIFKEVFCLHAPASMIAGESTQDFIIGGCSIPVKTRLFVNVWSINRNPKYWKNQLEFQPERFIIPEGVDGKSDQY
ncbi:cytochrome P450 93A2-like [Papaver somniferum]|uniref:cytochrome P450 93A2-like n=1 Tax=Papaver somniferum TaxID=3469 RepID=UPI000E7009D2|nr:cytochrome P450 93A2-like [Papaver somniferum]